MKKIRRALMVLLAAALCCGAAASAHSAGLFNFFGKNKAVTISQEEYDRLSRFAKLDEIMQYIGAWYYEEPDEERLLQAAATGLVAGLGDIYSFYYTPDAWKESQEDDEGEYGGVGLELQGSYTDANVRITRVFRDTPAEAAGILKGDLLVRVADVEVDVYTMQEAVNIMRGAVGEAVEIEVYRDGEYLTFSVPRAVIHVNRIEYAMLDEQIGYIMLYQFAGESQAEFAQALSALRGQGAQALIVDLRDNGGGWVDAAVDIADLFLPKNQVLVYAQNRQGEKESLKTRLDACDDIPLVFLVNGSSASASEILAGGLQDLNRAALVGEKTFGKGVMQVVIPLEGDEDGFQLTYAQYFLPSGAAVHKVGLTPDVEIIMPEELAKTLFPLGDLSDPQLAKALEIARGLLPAQNAA